MNHWSMRISAILLAVASVAAGQSMRYEFDESVMREDLFLRAFAVVDANAGISFAEGAGGITFMQRLRQRIFKPRLFAPGVWCWPLSDCRFDLAGYYYKHEQIININPHLSSDDYIVAVIIHELAHAFGLRHSKDNDILPPVTKVIDIKDPAAFVRRLLPRIDLQWRYGVRPWDDCDMRTGIYRTIPGGYGRPRRLTRVVQCETFAWRWRVSTSAGFFREGVADCGLDAGHCAGVALATAENLRVVNIENRANWHRHKRDRRD